MNESPKRRSNRLFAIALICWGVAFLCLVIMFAYRQFTGGAPINDCVTRRDMIGQGLILAGRLLTSVGFVMFGYSVAIQDTQATAQHRRNVIVLYVALAAFSLVDVGFGPCFVRW